MTTRWQDKFSKSSSPASDMNMMEEDEAPSTIMLITGEDVDSNPQWVYARIPAENYLAFKEAEAKGNYDVTQYGEVLRFGTGVTPPDSIKKEMAELYDCDEQFEDKLMQMFEEVMAELPDWLTEEENQENKE